MMKRWMACVEMRLITHRVLLIALVSSAVLHVVATVGTPMWGRWTGNARSPEVPQFEAVLNPLATPEATVLDAARSRAVAQQPAGRRVRRPLVTPKSEATFSAPENAIAIDRPGSSHDGGSNATVGENGDAGAAAGAARETPLATVIAAESPLAVTEKTGPSATPLSPPQPAAALELPSRVSITYKASTSVADGIAQYTWKRDGTKYEFSSTIQATGFIVNMFAGTIVQQSYGAVNSAGIEPVYFSIRRGDRPVETVQFLRETKEIKLSRDADSRRLPMPTNLQDTQSFLFQLALEATKLKTPGDRLSIWVTNARGLNQYTFMKVDETTLETSLGPIETVHLVREASEPRDSYEVWLSPKHHYLPVKLKFFLDRFPAELIATNISSTP